MPLPMMSHVLGSHAIIYVYQNICLVHVPSSKLVNIHMYPCQDSACPRLEATFVQIERRPLTQHSYVACVRVGLLK